MRQATLSAIVIVVVALTGCPGGGGSIGDRCEQHNDCDSTLQCMFSTCVPRCQRAPECGDGYLCDDRGLCRLATGQRGDACTSEVDCAPGLSCQIDGVDVDDEQRLLASCTEPNAGRPAGSPCATDEDCHNGTCGLGHCIDLCSTTRDCGAGNSCMTLPRIGDDAETTPLPVPLFDGCLLSQGNLVWSIPVAGPQADVFLPVPSGARYASLVLSVGDVAQSVGATEVTSPSGALLLEECELDGTPLQCDEAQELDHYYGNMFVRHRHEPSASVLALPANPALPLETGAYRVKVSSARANGLPGSAIPNVTAVVRMGSAALLDLHFHFLDLADHPCDATYGGLELDAAIAQTEPFFQSAFLGELRAIFAGGGIALGSTTYEDIPDRPALDGLDLADAGTLFSLGTHETGVNVFFVRTLSPVGLQALGPGPGAAGLAGTRRSGIAIAVDSLCYRTFEGLARITAHEIARYMGLYHNVEINESWSDPIFDTKDHADTDPGELSENLMFFSELGGTVLTPDQKDILSRSPVLR